MTSSRAQYIVTCTSGLQVRGGQWITLQAAGDLARDLSARQGHERCLHQVHGALDPLPAVSTYFRGHIVTDAERPRYDVRTGGATIASFPGAPCGMDAAWAGVSEMFAARGVTGAHVVSVAEDGTETLQLGGRAASPGRRRARSAMVRRQAAR